MSNENTIIKNHSSDYANNKIPIKKSITCNTDKEWLMMIHVISNIRPVSVELHAGSVHIGKCIGDNIQEIPFPESKEENTLENNTVSNMRKFKVIMFGTEDYMNFRREKTEKYCFPTFHFHNLKCKVNYEHKNIDFSHLEIEYCPGYDHGTKYSEDDLWDFISLKNGRKMILRISGGLLGIVKYISDDEIPLYINRKIDRDNVTDYDDDGMLG